MSDYQWHWYTGPRVSPCRVNVNTAQAYRYAVHLFGLKYPKAAAKLTQGAMFGLGGGAGASAGTHDGTSVMDVSVSGLTYAEIMWLVRCLRLVGFAAWYRPYLPGVWPAHIHCVLIGAAGLSRAAANQVPAFKNRRDGLARNGYDSLNPWVGWTTWGAYKARHAREVNAFFNNTSTGGLFGMTKTYERVCTRPVKLAKAKEVALPVDNAGSVSLMTGPTADWQVTVALTVTGLAKGDVLQLYPYSVNFKDKSVEVWRGARAEIIGTAGTTYGQATFNSNLASPPAGWSRRLRIRCASLTDGVTITRIDTYARKA
jgi:hypothetical protein